MLMLTRDGCVARRNALIKAANVDVLVVTNPRHIQYLCGMYNTHLALADWGPNALFIDTATGATTLVVHNFIADTAQTAHVDKIETWRWYDAATDPGIDPYRAGIDQLNARLRSLAGKRIGVEIGWLPLGVEVANPVDIAGILWTMQRSKMPDELVLIRAAISATGAGHSAARRAIQAGMTELDIYTIFQTAVVKAAGHAVLLMGDFVSGPRAEGTGGVATNRVLQSGDLMICDVFPVVNGYRGDCTATLSVGGKLTDTQRRLEAALHAGMRAGESLLRPGSVAGDVYRAVRQAIADGGFDGRFPHHAGHGLGLGHPDSPYFVPNSQEVLVAGDVVTLEPGAYGAGYGGRIEHNYLITESGFERLSQHQTSFV